MKAMQRTLEVLGAQLLVRVEEVVPNLQAVSRGVSVMLDRSHHRAQLALPHCLAYQ